MLADLHIPRDYDGFLYLAESVLNPPVLSPHRHLELELNVVAEGRITYVFDGRRLTFEKRALVWMFPAQEHQLIDRSADARYYVAVFKPEMIGNACRGEDYRPLGESGEPGGPVMHCDLEPGGFEHLCRIMDELMADGPDAATLNREAGFGAATDFTYRHADPDWLNSGLRHLLLLSWRLQRGRHGRNRAIDLHPGVARAIDLLGKPDTPQDLKALARLCGMSPAYLSRLFRRQVGVPLTRYRNSVRLARFWQIHRDGGSKTLLESVYAAGFGSYAQFYRVFTETHGSGPRGRLIGPGMAQPAGEAQA